MDSRQHELVFLNGEYDKVAELRIRQLQQLFAFFNIKQDDFQFCLDVFHALYLQQPKINKNHPRAGFFSDLIRLLDEYEIRKYTAGNESLSLIITALLFLFCVITEQGIAAQYLPMKKLQEIAERLYYTSIVYCKYAGKEPGTLELAEMARSTPSVDVKQLLATARQADKLLSKGEAAGIYSAELGKDMKRVLRWQLALPDELFYYKYATSTFLQYSKTGGKLDEVVLCVDKSGSMSGSKITWATAVALELAKLCRKCYLLLFDAEVHGPFTSKKEIIDKLLRVQAVGGTNISKALERAEKLSPKIIILITDGEDEVNYQPKKKLISVMIKGDNKDLKKISKQYLHVQLDARGILRLVSSLADLYYC